MINLTFKTYEEMIAFANQILGKTHESAPLAPVATQMPAPTKQEPVPTQMPQYTLDDLANVAGVLMDTNMEGLLNLLSSFGVQSLPELPAEQYCAFAAGLRELGGAI